MPRVLVIGCDVRWRERLTAELSARGAESVSAADREQAIAALSTDRFDAIVTALEPCPRSSGLGMLIAARTRLPRARRVLVVPRRAVLTDAAIATGLVDRIVAGPVASARMGALAEWLTAVSEHGPRSNAA